jgi:hypothetical protein
MSVNAARKSDGAEKVPNGSGRPFFGGYKMFIPSFAIVCRGAKRVCFFLRPVRRDFFSTVKSACATYPAAVIAGGTRFEPTVLRQPSRAT